MVVGIVVDQSSSITVDCRIQYLPNKDNVVPKHVPEYYPAL